MKRKSIAALTCCIFLQLLGTISLAQSGTGYFYYYKGAKIPLELNTRRIALNFETGDSPDAIQSILSGYNITPHLVKEDKTRGTLMPDNGDFGARPDIKTFYSETETTDTGVINYKRRINELNAIPEVLIASPCFKSASAKNAGLTNFFYVKLKDDKDRKLLKNLADDFGIEITGRNKFMPLWFTLSCRKNSKMNALEAANHFYETGWFESAEPAFIYEDLEMSADPLYNTQWGLNNTGQNAAAYTGIDINAEEAWAITKGVSTIKIAIFDQGFELNHPDLKANTYGSGFNAQTGRSPSQVLGPHATAVAGIAGAVQNNALGISGVAPGCRLLSVSISMLASDPPQSYADGINWAWKNGADIINNSWGGMNPSGIVDDAITNALTKGRSGKGTVIVFAAGNSGEDVFYPANSNPLIIAVGAISFCGERKSATSCDGKAWASCYGNTLDVVAPGVAISTTDRVGSAGYKPNDYNTAFSGTSAATPFVSGVAALMLSVNPALTVQDVNDAIERSAQKVRTDIYNYTTAAGRPNGDWNAEMGYGLVDAVQALHLSGGSGGCETSVTLNCSAQTENSITVEWEKVKSAEHYLVEYKEASASEWITLPPVAAQSHIIRNLAAGTSYDVRVKPNCKKGPGKPSSVMCNTTSAGNGNNNRKELSATSGSSVTGNNLNDDIAEAKGLVVFPNPANNQATLQIPFKGSYSVTITDMQGRRCITFTDARPDLQLSLKNLTPGLYNIVVTAKDGTASMRTQLLKQ